ncbi:MAG: tetratricopeptide repeat protein [Treponema sp.]|jgi:tetratricopeptide (TPR) repeat protein|nr:tetratricopeptide repeat protein [Treponema sp.]
MSNINEKAGAGESINNFIQKNRKPVFIGLGVFAAVFAGFVVSLSVADALEKRAINAAEEFGRRFDALRFNINEESSAADVEALLRDLNDFAPKNSGYAGGRAWGLIGAIHADKKEWADAEKAYTSAANTASRTYLGAISWFNAAVAAEEQGKLPEAVEFYQKSLSSSGAFPAAPRAQFSIGRLKEAGNDRDAALEAYRAVISGWPYDTVWTNLAHSKIIALETAAPGRPAE